MCVSRSFAFCIANLRQPLRSWVGLTYLTCRALDMLEQVEPRFQATRAKVLEAHHFGQFLQKVNLLKDQLTDISEGREFVFSRDELKQSLARNATGAMDFLHSIPFGQREFRLFCAWSLFLELATIPAADRAHRKSQLGKVGRTEAEAVIAQTEESWMFPLAQD